MENLGADPFGTFGSQHLSSNGQSGSMGADAFTHADGWQPKSTQKPVVKAKEIPKPIVAEVAQAEGDSFMAASGTKVWNKELIVQRYKNILTNVDSLKADINAKNLPATRSAIAALIKELNALDKLVK